jgi:4-hydroxy-tetrahydrodipicolinate synthase
MRYDDLQGIIPPMVTPFTEAGELDEELHRADVRFLIDKAGVHGLAVCTSTGEGYTLSAEECCTVTRWTVEEAAGAVPVIAGVIADSTHAAIRRANAVADLGIKALLVPPVHYVYQPDEDSTLKFFADIVEASGTAVIIDNVVPWFYLSPDLLSRILQDVPGVIGVKQSANDLKALADLLWLIEEKGIRTGPRIFSAVNPLLFPSFMLGAHGAIAAITTASPEWCVQLWNATRESDQSDSLRIHKQLLTMWAALEGENLPANVKGAMWLQKRKAGFPRAPIPMSPPARRGKLRAALGLR